MLLITRKDREEILIGNDVRIVVTKTKSGSCQLAIQAPDDVLILRGELLPHAKDGRRDEPPTAT